MLHFIPALLLLLVNSHLGHPGELSGFVPTPKMIWALRQPDNSPAVRRQVASMAVRALAWVGRWQSPVSYEILHETDLQIVAADAAQAIHCPDAFGRGDRSRDGPA